MNRLQTIWGTCALILAGASAEAGDLRPPLVGMSEHADPKKTVSVELPVNWKAEGPAPIVGGLQRWSGFIQPPKPDGPDAWVEISLQPTWSRVELAHWGHSVGWPGKRQEGTLQRGDGWIEEVRKDDAKQKFYLLRLVEKDGRVYELAAHSHETIYPHIDGHLRAIFDTFKTLGKPPLASPPAGYAASTADGIELWTDTKDKKTLQRALTARSAAWTAAAQTLPGDLAITDPPIVVVCDKDPAYTQLTQGAASRFSPTAVVSYQQRLLAVRVGGKTNAMFDRTVQNFAALQYMQHYFGGKGPDWVERGLGIWVVVSLATKGKPEKPPPEFVNGAKDAVAARKDSLDVALGSRREDIAAEQFENFDMSSYAWHCFFRFGAGATPYGDRYRRYLEDLRKTGSPDEAKKAWDGVNMATLATEFQKWTASWR